MTDLHILNGYMEGQSFELQNDIIFIGRSPDNDIQIKDSSISRKHVKVIKKGDKFFIEDLKSYNGTWIDGSPITPGNKFEVEEGLPVAIGNIFITLGRKYSEDGMVTQYSINLRDETGERRRDLLYKDCRVTNRERLELIYEVSTILMQSLDINQICEKMMDSLFSCLERIDGGAIVLIDHSTGKLKEIINRSRNNKRNLLIDLADPIIYYSPNGEYRG